MRDFAIFPLKVARSEMLNRAAGAGLKVLTEKGGGGLSTFDFPS